MNQLINEINLLLEEKYEMEFGFISKNNYIENILNNSEHYLNNLYNYLEYLYGKSLNNGDLSLSRLIIPKLCSVSIFLNA